MVEVYVLVEKKKSVLKAFMAWLCLCLALICLFLSCSMYLFFIIGILFGALWYFLLFKSGLEYEYSYFDGELRFAKIMSKSRRKALKSYHIEDVVTIAPAGDRSVYNYENDNNVKMIDYTSGNKDAGYYDIVIKDKENNKYLLIKAELDDKYLDAVCHKNASKVVQKAGV